MLQQSVFKKSTLFLSLVMMLMLPVSVLSYHNSGPVDVCSVLRFDNISESPTCPVLASGEDTCTLPADDSSSPNRISNYVYYLTAENIGSEQVSFTYEISRRHCPEPYGVLGTTCSAHCSPEASDFNSPQSETISLNPGDSRQIRTEASWPEECGSWGFGLTLSALESGDTDLSTDPCFEQVPYSSWGGISYATCQTGIACSTSNTSASSESQTLPKTSVADSLIFKLGIGGYSLFISFIIFIFSFNHLMLFMSAPRKFLLEKRILDIINRL